MHLGISKGNGEVGLSTIMPLVVKDQSGHFLQSPNRANTELNGWRHV